MKKSIFFVLCLLPLWAVQAQDRVSLQTVIELALENDIRLMPGKIQLKVSQLQQSPSAVWEDPEVRVEPSVDSDENYFDSALRFYLPHPWRLKADGMERASKTAASTAELQMGRVQVAVEMFQLYRGFQCLEKEYAFATRLIDVKQQRSELAREQVAASVKTSTDALLLRWELRDAQREARTLQREMDLIKGRLAGWIGQSLDELLLDPLPEEEFSVSAGRNPAVETALELRPDLHLLYAQLELAESQVRQVEAERIPWFNHVQAGYSDSSEEWQVQAAVSLPIFSFGGSKKRQALAEQSFRVAAIDASRDAISLEVNQAARVLNNAVEEWQMQQQELGELAGEAEKEIKALQEYASGEPDEWMKLQERLIQAERRLLDVRRSVYAARADYLLATGQTSLN